MKEQENLQNDCALCQSDPEIARIWGCKAPSPERGGFVYNIGGKPTRRCPISLCKDQTVQTALRLYRAYKHGHLPKPGALDDQSAFYCEIMYACESFEIAAANWDMQQTQSKAAKQRKALQKKGR